MKPPVDDAESSAGERSRGPLNLLVVDDQRSQLKLMALLLQQAFPDCRTCEVQDPLEACELATTHPFDCVVADYQMPRLNGVELASRLRAFKPYLPIILCTGSGDEMLVAEAMTNGVNQYLPKARVNAESLHRTISHAIKVTAHERLIAEQQHELEHFSYALAHDFKQPIRQIKTFSRLVLSELESGRTESIRPHAEFLAKAAERLARLVDVMSEYALLRKAPDLVNVPLARVLGELEEALAPYVAERNGRLRVETDAVVVGDQTLVYQILQNLIVNGLKYNKSAVPEVRVRSHCAEGVCSIRVADNGIGIPAEFRERIFQPLTRLHGQSEYEGSGLGLTLARKATISQGGTISCTSRVGEGSEFLVTLPAAADHASEDRARLRA